ncbi:MAG: 16S rRNA (uracil(1498)-N(3))-methyltransferase [Nitrospirota bacterium]
MPHFFLAPGSLQGDAVIITDALARHLAGSLRCREGDRITVVSEEGRRYRIEVVEATTRRVSGRVIDALTEGGTSAVRVTLVQAILKGDHMDAVVQKATELGVHRIVPLITRRTVVRPKHDRSARQVERWRAIALEAAQQSERLTVPRVDDVRSLPDWLHARSGDRSLRWLLRERETQRHLRDELSSRSPAAEVALVVGPEGGFEEEEIDLARAAGCGVVSLGRAILRAETAGVTAVAILQYAWGELGGPQPGSAPAHV